MTSRRFWMIFGGVAISILLLVIAVYMSGVGTACYLRIASVHDADALVPFAQARLSSKNALVRSEAARALGSIGTPSAAANADLLRALKDESPQVAANAAWALGNIQTPDLDGRPSISEIVAALIEGLAHKDGEVRRYCAYALSLYGSKASAALPALTDKLADEHMAYMAARALGEMGSVARDTIPQLTALLSSPNTATRAEAAIALANLGPLPEATVAKIKGLLNDDEQLVRDTAQRALAWVVVQEKVVQDKAVE
ncbi:MAG: HEAT repeat domain-containing protein [Pirellulales bacterium]